MRMATGAVLQNVQQIGEFAAVMYGWANYFRHAVAKNVFAMLDHFAWWRAPR